MSNDIFSRLNPGISDLAPYEPGKPIDDVAKEYGISNIIKLASNENPLGASPKALRSIADLDDSLHLYPDGNCTELKNAIAHHEKVAEGSVILGNGSNEVLELIARAWLNPSRNAITSRHAFAVYKIVTQAAGAKLIEVEAKNWKFNLEAFHNYLNEETAVIFIANPNNPTGTYNTHKEIEDFLLNVPSNILVVLDCAYYEYVQENDYVDVHQLLNKYENLIVTKSFSKIQGLAAIRLGYGLANASLIESLNRIRQPFNINSFAQKLAISAIDDKEHIQKSIDVNQEGLKYLSEELSKLKLTTIPSVGNFISFNGQFNGKELFEALLRKGIIVRQIDLYDMPDFIRVTVGTMEQNQIFISALKELL